jgi:hypothetical protein
MVDPQIHLSDRPLPDPDRAQPNRPCRWDRLLALTGVSPTPCDRNSADIVDHPRPADNRKSAEVGYFLAHVFVIPLQSTTSGSSLLDPRSFLAPAIIVESGVRTYPSNGGSKSGRKGDAL